MNSFFNLFFRPSHPGLLYEGDFFVQEERNLVGVFFLSPVNHDDFMTAISLQEGFYFYLF